MSPKLSSPQRLPALRRKNLHNSIQRHLQAHRLFFAASRGLRAGLRDRINLCVLRHEFKLSRCLLTNYRQLNGKCRPVTFAFTRRRNCTVVRCDQSLADRQTQSQPAETNLNVAISLFKRLKNA